MIEYRKKTKGALSGTYLAIHGTTISQVHNTELGNLYITSDSNINLIFIKNWVVSHLRVGHGVSLNNKEKALEKSRRHLPIKWSLRAN